MEFTTAHFLARTTINNFNQPLKTELKKKSHILMGSEILLSEISSQVKYNFKIKLYYVKIQRNIARATSNEIKKIAFFRRIKKSTCSVRFLYLQPIFLITAHLLFLKVHFLVKPNAYLLGKFAAQRGGE